LIFLAKIFYYLFHKLRIYTFWSHIYRFLYHRRYKNIPLDSNLTPVETLKKLQRLKWSKDRFKELFDAFGSPHWVQYCINQTGLGNPQPSGALDCDEFSIWSAWVLKAEFKPVILNVNWHDADGFDGHNVCLFEILGKYRHIGNWGLSESYTSRKNLIEEIVSKATGDQGKLIGWAVYTKNLKLTECHTDLRRA